MPGSGMTEIDVRIRGINSNPGGLMPAIADGHHHQHHYAGSTTAVGGMMLRVANVHGKGKKASK